MPTPNVPPVRSDPCGREYASISMVSPSMVAGAQPLRSPGPAAMSRILPVVAEQPATGPRSGRLRALWRIGRDRAHRHA